MSRSEKGVLKSLHDVIKSEDIDSMESLLKSGVDPNALNDDGRTALNYLCSRRKFTKAEFKMIQILIQYGADVNIPNVDGYNPIMFSVFAAEDFVLRFKLFKLLLENGADVTRVNNDGSTVLHLILCENPKKNPIIRETVEMLLEHGVDVNIKEIGGYTELHLAIMNSQPPEVVDLLLKNGANLNSVDAYGRTVLNYLCLRETLTKPYLDIIEFLIQLGADVNIQNVDGYSPIMASVFAAEDFVLRLKLFKLLLENGADVTRVNNDGSTVLHLILCENPKKNPIIRETVEMLLEHGVDVNIKDKSGYTAFFLATVNSQPPEVVDLLLKNGANLNSVDAYGRTVLNYLCLRETLTKPYLDIIEFLIQLGADVNIQNVDGYSPIMASVFAAEDFVLRLKLFKLLLENGADVTRVNNDGSTVLHLILREDPKKFPIIRETVEMLLEHGVDVNIKDKSGYTAFFLATVNCQPPEVIDLLLKNGANLNSIDAEGRTALNYLCSRRKFTKAEFKMIQILIQYGADVNIPNVDGYSPIMASVLDAEDFELCLKLFKLLLENGADVTRVNNDGSTLLHLIFREDPKKFPIIREIVEMLLEHGVDVNIKDKSGYTAFFLATANCHQPEVIDLLLKNGANLNSVDAYDRTVLNYLCSRRKFTKAEFKMIQILIQYGADVNIHNVDGTSPLMASVLAAEDFELRLKLFKLLLENGADVTRVNNDGSTLLHLIFRKNPKNFPIIRETVEMLLEHGVDVNIKDKSGYTAFFLATVNFQPPEVIDLLLKNGANLNSIDAEGRTALNYLCSRRKFTKAEFKMIQTLIQYGADVNIPNVDGYSPIMASVFAPKYFKFRLKVLKLLLENGADVSHVNNDGISVLHVIFWERSKKNPIIRETVEMVLEHGVDVNIKDKRGYTALHLATVACKNPKIIDLLLKNGADPNAANIFDRTPVFSICEKFDWTRAEFKITQLLIQYKADLGVKSHSGESPIMISISNARSNKLRLLWLLVKNYADNTIFDVFSKEVLKKMFEGESVVNEVQFMLKNGMNINIQAEDGRSALHYAALHFTVEHVEFLLNNGADPNLIDAEGNIPLNYIFNHQCMNDNVLENILKILKLNIKSNADLHHIRGDGKTLLHSFIISVSNDNILNYWVEDYKMRRISKLAHQIIEILLKHGLDVNVKDRDGLSPLNEAVSYCNYDVANFLIENGADVNTVQFKGGYLKDTERTCLNLQTILNVLAIIKLLQDKSFQITNYQYLTLFKFLTLFDYVDVNIDPYVSLYCYPDTHAHWEIAREFGSGSVIRKLIERLIRATVVKSDLYGDLQMARNVKESLYDSIKKYLFMVECGNMYIDIETYNHLQESLNSLVLYERPDSHTEYEQKTFEKILEQVVLARKTIISNNVSVLDLCTFGPDKTDRLLRKCDCEIKDFREKLHSFPRESPVGKMIEGYITKALVRRLLRQESTDSIKLFTRGILPDLCCDKIFKFLDTCDLVSLYEAAI